MAPSGGRFRWGILGTGAIAGQFATELRRAEGAELHAVASRERERARSFAAAHGASIAHGSYEALLADPAVDIVYVATQAERHHDHCLAALDAGKPVLCEKPFGLSAREAAAMAAGARARNLFCMEAMWMRFSPLVRRAREHVRSGRLGAIGFLRAEVGYRAGEARLREASPGHGALLNFGVYGLRSPISSAARRRGCRSKMTRHASGLDESFCATLRYPTHIATISAGIGAAMTNEAVVVGSAGRLRLGAPFFNPGYLQYVREDMREGGSPARASRLAERLPGLGLLQGSFVASWLRGRGQIVARPRGAHGLRLEAEEVMRCLRDGETESPVVPLAETVAVMETLDAIRAAAGSA